MSTQAEAIEAIESGENVGLFGPAGCVDKDTEFFSRNGWKKISEYVKGDEVGTYHPNTGEVYLEDPADFIKLPCKEMNYISAKGLDMVLTDEHRVVYWPTKTSEKPSIISCKEMMERHRNSKICGWSGLIKTTFKQGGGNSFLSEGELRLQVAVIADGRIVKEGKDNYTQMRFNRERKYLRLLELCKDYDLRHDDRGINNQGQYEVIVWPKLSDKIFDEKYYSLPQNLLEVIVDEVKYWDGAEVINKSSNTVRFFSTKKQSADFIQYAMAACGRNTSIVFDKREDKPCYTVNGTTRGDGFRRISTKGVKNEIKSFIAKDGFKYCFTVSTTIWLARRNGKIFITGNTGKSHIIHQVNSYDSILVAPTGIAALNIGGETCHSTFGLPFGLVTEDDKKQRSKKCSEIFGSGLVEKLIIDEISMVRADYLDLIDLRLRKTLDVEEPFGGLQVITVGDPAQLPPIVAQKEKRHFRRMYRSPWFFSSNVWEEGEFDSKVLTKIYRQDDLEQIEVLNSLRLQAEGWQEGVQKLNDWAIGQQKEDRLVLCNYVKDADSINQKHYDSLKGEERAYIAKKGGKFRATDCIVDEVLKLKVGAKVIICANGQLGAYKNGQIGVVVSFHDNYVCVELEDTGEVVQVEKHVWERQGYKQSMTGLKKEVEGTFVQIPLRLGYAISVHKSQGMTLDAAEINLGERTFAPHQAYVALSRVRDLKNIKLTRPLTEQDIIVDQKVIKFYEEIM